MRPPVRSHVWGVRFPTSLAVAIVRIVVWEPRIVKFTGLGLRVYGFCDVYDYSSYSTF